MVNIMNGLTPFDGVLVGGQPTRDQFEEAQAAGFRTIINLRGIGEVGTDVEPGLVAELGMTYHHLPISGAAGITFDNAEALDKLMGTLEGPVMVHCASGNRVGALFALKAYKMDGKSAQDALNEGLRAGLTSLEGYVRTVLDL